MELDPLSAIIAQNLTRILYYARRYDEALGVARKGLELDPKLFFGHFIQCEILVAEGRIGEAEVELRKAQELVAQTELGNQNALTELAVIYARSGRRQGAVEALQELKRIATHPYVAPHYFAMGMPNWARWMQPFSGLIRRCK